MLPQKQRKRAIRARRARDDAPTRRGVGAPGERGVRDQHGHVAAVVLGRAAAVVASEARRPEHPADHVASVHLPQRVAGHGVPRAVVRERRRTHRVARPEQRRGRAVAAPEVDLASRRPRQRGVDLGEVPDARVGGVRDCLGAQAGARHREDVARDGGDPHALGVDPCEARRSKQRPIADGEAGGARGDGGRERSRGQRRGVATGEARQQRRPARRRRRVVEFEGQRRHVELALQRLRPLRERAARHRQPPVGVGHARLPAPPERRRARQGAEVVRGEDVRDAGDGQCPALAHSDPAPA
ncbi:MAG: hypothetical protein EBR30_24705 [Cytophagia bacterium]|nr:hypothetical protein [Cytophagia bacterium]